nr:MAG TPA: hypothetical protein [Bacteriophage sp.]
MSYNKINNRLIVGERWRLSDRKRYRLFLPIF